MKSTWLTYYREKYYPLLESNIGNEKFSNKRGLCKGLYQRAEGFNIMFAYLESLGQDQYNIIETGTLRTPGNWKDGQSALLFTEFVDHYSGTVRSVDIDQGAVDTANSSINSTCFKSYCSDSVAWLTQQTDLDQVDLFYLDSWDVKWNNDHNSAEHHLKEFLAIEPHLKPGAIVAIDDNARFLETNARTGKGRRVAEYLESKGIMPIYDAYQIIYKL
jgi:hypothetical protein